MGGIDAQNGYVGFRLAGAASIFLSLRRYVPALTLLAAISSFAGFEAARFRAPLPWGSTDSVQAASLPGTSSADPDPVAMDMARLGRLAPQQQAERTLQAAIHRDPHALELIEQSVEGWRGQLRNTDSLVDLIHTAMNANDLRVRGAALEVDLAASNLTKSPESVTHLVAALREHPQETAWALWRLGALGNRGVEPEVVLQTLIRYASSSNAETRYWAVEGLAALGSDAAVDPLLDRFAHDPSARVRQRAACNLAQSGMLTKEQRLAAVPDLLNFFEDDALGSDTRGWVYGALRLITGQALGNDADAWRRWWAQRDTRHRHRSGDPHVFFA